MVDQNGKELAVLKGWTSQEAATMADYARFSSDLSRYKGQKVGLKFEWKEDNAEKTTWYIDDINVEIYTK